MTPDVRQFDLVVLGAGAAGLMCAAVAGARGRRVALLEHSAQPGRKILISGGGRCNVTHDVVRPEDFCGANPRMIAQTLRHFTVADTIAFFAELGVVLKTEDTGKLFPVSDDAHTVLDALLRACARAGAAVRGACPVTAVATDSDGFVLTTPDGPLRARRLVIATGGRSLPKTGSDGSGYRLAQVLGHTVAPQFPALVPLVLEKDHWLTGLSGIAVDALLTLRSASGRTLHRQQGAVLCTHFGLSGPAVMDISRHWIAAHAADPAVTLTADLTAGQEFSAVESRLLEHARKHPRATAAAALRPLLPERLAVALCRHAAGIDPATSLAHLTRDDRRALLHALTALPLPVLRDRGYLFAEVTAGGVPLDEIDPATMASRRCPGLYFCGEILDADGRNGGYNFQWAWCTGFLAGRHAAASLFPP